MLWRVGREWGSYVKDVTATGYGCPPALVRAKIGGNEGDSLRARCACSFERRADIRFALKRADGSAHIVSGAKELVDAMGGYEARAAGDENEVSTHVLTSYRTCEADQLPPAGPYKVLDRNERPQMRQTEHS